MAEKKPIYLDKNGELVDAIADLVHDFVYVTFVKTDFNDYALLSVPDISSKISVTKYDGGADIQIVNDDGSVRYVKDTYSLDEVHEKVVNLLKDLYKEKSDCSDSNKKLIYRDEDDNLVVDESLKGNKVTLFENELIEVFTTGSSFSFVANIENKVNKELCVLCYKDEVCIHVYTIGGNDWVGVLPDEEGWDTLVAICAGEFFIEIENEDGRSTFLKGTESCFTEDENDEENRDFEDALNKETEGENND